MKANNGFVSRAQLLFSHILARFAGAIFRSTLRFKKYNVAPRLGVHEVERRIRQKFPTPFGSHYGLSSTHH